MTDTPRLAATKTLLRVVKDKAYSNIELANTAASGNTADRALCEAIVRTALERKNTLDHIISLFARREPDVIVKCLLYTGLSQIFYMDKIPDSASCDETVKAAKALTDKTRAGFVNGLLRNVLRNREAVEQSIAGSDDSVRYSMDKSICLLIREQYQPDAERIFKSSFIKPKLCVRVNTLKNDIATLAAYFGENGVESEIEDGLLRVAEGKGTALSLADTGRFYIQGAPSQYAVSLLDAKPGMTVIDVCACPGGKIMGAAIDMENQGAAIAFDIHKNKLPLIVKSSKKLGLTIIETQENDSRFPVPALKNTADAVICDVPCSSLGVMASKPEIRYKDITDLSDLYKIQAEILDASASYVKRGGALVYSTCTLNKVENGEQVKKFLKRHGDFMIETEKQFIDENGALDGFYAARLVRLIND